MPGSNTTGGKYHKRGKKHKVVINDTKIEFADAHQVYGYVKKKSGGSRLILDCSDRIERSGIIPGKFFKKVWMNAGDIVLCDLNVGGNDSQCYIVHKYSNKDAFTLKTLGKIDFDVVEETPANSNYSYVEEKNESVDEKYYSSSISSSNSISSDSSLEVNLNSL